MIFMLQETLRYPSNPAPLPPKDGWNSDPKDCVKGTVK